MKVTTIKQGHKTSPLALSMTSACDPDISKLLVQRDVGGSRGSWSGSRSNPVYSNFLTCHVTSKYNHHFVWREGARSGHSQHTPCVYYVSRSISRVFFSLSRQEYIMKGNNGRVLAFIAKSSFQKVENHYLFLRFL